MVTMSGAFGPRDLTEQSSLLGLSIALVPMLCVKGGHHVCDTDCGGRSKWKERKKSSLTMTLKQDSNMSSSTQVSGMGRWGRWERPVWWPQECHLEFPSREPTVGAAFPSNLQLPFLGINLGAGPSLLCPQAVPGW